MCDTSYILILSVGMTQVVHKFEDLMHVYSRVSTYELVN